ncbi:TatD DNase family protein [Entomoplasma freundtii]|uniref:Mg-dependent DNase n=1 Tax=Entomoplasma freundtii TaxID=74700 RepID=A0A2K8NQE4_9MOLU|nr:TatD family hydrolase [Entomoplasma freundtii]ATZ16065.1 Mg-dependent DNase [Entomoplasma freundtii]TDY58066.1 TatD DNase family protein [Entomoplasma freundtii]
MAGIYDVHCHLNDNLYIELDISSSELVRDAKDSGIDLLNCVGYDVKSSKLAIIQAEKNSQVYALVGIHPNEAHLFSDEAVEQIDFLANANKVVGIGEIGLDYSRSKRYKDRQRKIFRDQLNLAIKHNLPVCLHFHDDGSDQVYRDGLKILKEFPKLKGAMLHSFAGPWAVAEEFLNLGCYLSFNGDITNNKNMREAATRIPWNRMLVESDAPYKAPRPYEKKINYPRFLPVVINVIASLRNVSSEVVIATTSDNGRELFGLNGKKDA